MNKELVKAEYSFDSVSDSLSRVRAGCPVIHNITNYVVMNTTANALLAVGASPVMAHAPEEVVEITAASKALVLNIGTLSGEWVEAMMMAGVTARERNIPVVLDPVGVGFSSYRSAAVLNMLKRFTPSVIKGNASEIQALAHDCGLTDIRGPVYRGVDSASAAEEAFGSAVSLSNRFGCTVTVTGPVDYVTDGIRFTEISSGAAVMARTTGMGCTASALTGALAAVLDDPFTAAVHAMSVMGKAGEAAASHSAGNGSFQMNFLDELYNMGTMTYEWI